MINDCVRKLCIYNIYHVYTCILGNATLLQQDGKKLVICNVYTLAFKVSYDIYVYMYTNVIHILPALSS